MKKLSKQAQAKAEQGYVAKPVWLMCGNCEHFRSSKRTVVTSHISGTGYTEEVGLRCDLGGFKAGKSATCKQHQAVSEEG